MRAVRYGALGAVAVLAGALVQLGPASAASSVASFTPATASIQHRVLKISGSTHADDIKLILQRDDNVVTVDFDDGARIRTFDRRDFGSVTVSLGLGDDVFKAFSNNVLVDPKISAFGGPGDDSITPGTGNDRVSGGSGDDVLFGGAGLDAITADAGDDQVDGGGGNDTETLGSGNDVAFWLPGEASDVVHGGPGRDSLHFIGAETAEAMRLSGTTAHAVFARDPGAVRMTLDSVEAVRADLLGGPDSVTLNGSNSPENVDVRARSGEVNVTGLPLTVKLTDTHPGDALQINTRGGHDQAVVHRGVQSLIATGIDLGPGNPEAE